MRYDGLLHPTHSKHYLRLTHPTRSAIALKAQYPPKLIRDKFNLTDAQIEAALSYIEVNKTQVEAEYQEVLQTREEIRQYWEDYNRQRFAKIAAMPRKPEKSALWAKLEQQKARRIAEKP